MHYNGPIVRPQTDADSLFIEVTVGCTHNRCKYCNFYDGYPFSVAPIAQIEADLIEASKRYPNARKIWANGGNPYALSADKLIAIGTLIKQYFPNSRISTYARVDDITRKSVEEIRQVKDAGFEDLLIGFETGDDEVLAYVNKGYAAEDILTGCKRLEEAGVDYRMIYLGGLAGQGNCKESARKTARLLNQLHPYLIYLNSVSILPGTQLYKDREAKRFYEAGEKELMEELIELLEHMENDIYVFAAPNTTPMSLFVNLQENKPELLAKMRRLADSMAGSQGEEMAGRRKKSTSI